MTKIAMSVEEAAKAAGISRSALYQQIQRGELRVLKIGRRSVVRLDDLNKWLNTRPAIKPKYDAQTGENGQSRRRSPRQA